MLPYKFIIYVQLYKKSAFENKSLNMSLTT